MTGDEVNPAPIRPYLTAVFKARAALRWTGSAGPGSPLVGRVHPATIDGLLREAVPEYAVPYRERSGWRIMGIMFDADDTVERGLIVVERAPFVNAYRDPVPRPRELEGVRIETLDTRRATVRVQP
jgi:hypothetical protein